MLSRLSILCAAFLAVASADVLTLRSGRTVQGQYLGGDSRQVRMAIGDRIDTFQVDEVSNLQFSIPQRESAAAPLPRDTPPPPRDTPPPAETRVMRPDRDYDRDNRDSRRSTYSSATEIPSGTSLTVRMIDSVDSERDHVGQTFQASIDEPVVVNGEVLIPRGANVVAKLVDDKESGKFEGRTVLTLDLMQVQVNGRMVDINTQEITQSSSSRGARTGKVVGGTAALGAIIGAIAGGGKGAAIGAAGGAAAGGGVQVLTKGQKVHIPAETRLTFVLQQSTPL